MANIETFFRSLFPFKGFCVGNIEFNGEAMQVEMHRDRRCKLPCPSCERAMTWNGIRWQSAWDLPFGPINQAWLRYEAVQGWCRHCDLHWTHHPAEVEPKQRATNRLMNFVSRLARLIPLSQIYHFVPISPATAYRWDKRSLQRRLPEPDFEDLKVLLVDEKSIGKGHRYVTCVMNGVSGEFLYAAEGKKRESLKGFFDQLTADQKAAIEAVVIDRNGAFREVVQEELSADIIYDKFHVISNYNKIIDDIRRKEWRKAQKEDKQVVKGQRYNLFRNPENLTDKQEIELQELLALNENLNRAYVLKDALKNLWTYRYPKAAKNYLSRWAEWAHQTGIDLIKKFADGLLKDQEEIANFCKYPFTNARMEGFNNLISRILHRTCGVKDLEYLFLRLRQESLHLHP